MKLIRFEEKKEVPASHEDAIDPGVVKRVLLDAGIDIAGCVQMVNWATLLPGRSFRAHYHEDMHEIFLVIEEGIVARINGKEIPLGRGDTLVVYPGETHEMKNTTDQRRLYIVVGISGGKNGKSVSV